jgi:hypothetical protein
MILVLGAMMSLVVIEGPCLSLTAFLTQAPSSRQKDVTAVVHDASVDGSVSTLWVSATL